MKKSLENYIIIFSLFSIILFSCSNSKKIETNKAIKDSINNYMYTYTLNGLISVNENSFSYMPDSLINLFNRNVIKDGIFYTVYDLLYPGRINQHNTLNFYDLYNDNGSWVDSLVISAEEERIANQILELEENFADVIEPVNQEEEKEQAKENEEIIKEYVKNEVTTNDNKLSYMEYGDEKFIPQVLDNNYILIHSDKNNVTRFFYDNLFRCYKKESWNISSNVEDLIYTTETKYKEDSYIKSEEFTVSKDNRKNLLFNEKGQLVEEKDFYIKDSKNYIKSETKFKYNEENKVKESIVTEYNYIDDNYSKLSYSFVKKYVYKYNNDDIPANFDYYENNILKMKNKYYSDNTYTSQIFFDDGYSVTSYYQNNLPVKEIFSINGRVERVNTYEQ